MKKKLLALICLTFAVVMCLSSCTILTRFTSIFDKGDKINSENEGDPNCIHLWSNGSIDTECDTSKDAVFTKECYYCGEKVSKDIRTTVTEEEYNSAFLFENPPTNFTIEYYEYDSSIGFENVRGYYLSDGTALNAWYDLHPSNEASYFSYFTFKNDYDGFDDSEDIFFEAYTETMLYNILPPGSEYEDFYTEFPFDALTYDEKEKCYCLIYNETTNIRNEYKLYFMDGEFLAFYQEYIDLRSTEKYVLACMFIDKGNTSIEKPEDYAGELSKLVNDKKFQNADISYDEDWQEEYYSRDSVYELLSELSAKDIYQYQVHSEKDNNLIVYIFSKELAEPTNPTYKSDGEIVVYIENGKISSMEIRPNLNQWAIVAFEY